MKDPPLEQQQSTKYQFCLSLVEKEELVQSHYNVTTVQFYPTL